MPLALLDPPDQDIVVNLQFNKMGDLLATPCDPSSSASACGSVRGNPSNTAPAPQSVFPNRSSTRPMTILSGARLPSV